jgi:hypothetical protein
MKQSLFRVFGLGFWIILTSGCATLAPPISMESAILPEAAYTTQIGRTLAQQYRPNLVNIFSTIRGKYSYTLMEFLSDTTSIGFVTNPAKAGAAEPTFLAIQVGTGETFNTLQTDYNKRAATVFSRYGQELFNLAVSQKEVMQEPKVEGVLITIAWWAKNFLYEEYVNGTVERMTIVATKQDCEDFIAYRISNQEFLRKASIFGRQGDTQLGRIEVDLKQTL